MIHSTRTPSFPANIEYYAPWVATHGLVAPYGKCQCGCGNDAPIAKQNRRERGQLKGHPVRCFLTHSVGKRLFVETGFKLCPRCQEIKPRADFRQLKSGRDSGQSCSYCLECSRANRREWHHAHRDSELERIHQYQQANKAKLLNSARQRMTDPSYRKTRNEANRRWRAENLAHISNYDLRYKVEQSDKLQARTAVNRAVKTGELPPAWSMVCSMCDEAQAAHWHHHLGYSEENWLDVIPACVDCHARERRVEA